MDGTLQVIRIDSRDDVDGLSAPVQSFTIQQLYPLASSVTFLLYDMILTFGDEIDYIWSKPRTSWIKWQFLFTRYFALAAQIVNQCVDFKILTSGTVNLQGTRNYYTVQVVICSVLMTAVEAVLMLRVYALYNRNRWIGLTFLLLIVAEQLCLVIGIVVTLPDDTWSFEELFQEIPGSFAYFGVSAAVSQLTIIVLTIFKYKRAIKDGWGDTPLVVLLARDSFAVFTILFAVVTTTAIATMAHNRVARAGYFWTVSIVGSAGCRLIINMQHLPCSDSVANITTDPEISTVISAPETGISSRIATPLP